MQRHDQRRTGGLAFTLVELLVVMTLIGILISLLLPAVQVARESVRRTQCANNLRQLGLAAQNYHSAVDMLPHMKSWTCQQRTVNSKSAGNENHRSWIFAMLPFLEQQTLYDQMDMNKSGLDDTINSGSNVSNRSLLQRRLNVVVCPSDPNSGSLRVGADEASVDHPDAWYPGTGIPLAGTNYAANAGDHTPGVGKPLGWGQKALSPCNSTATISASEIRGVISRSGWSARFEGIFDGLSNTFLAGECISSICPWVNWGFENWGCTGWPINHLNAELLSQPYDWSYVANHGITYRSFHSGGAQFVYCDGHVQFLSETMDFPTYQALSSRNGGEPLGSP